MYGRDLTEELVERLGRGFSLWAGGAGALVGRDTRGSGPALERALAQGLCAGGSDVTLGGLLPSPAVALLADELGAVVSASHNPPDYNGVKFFSEGGVKLSDGEEEAVEELMEGQAVTAAGEITGASGLADRYVELVSERFGGPLNGLRVVVDCANGAMIEAGPTAFERLGAEVVAVATEPDGTNINVGCGATDLSLLSRVTPAESAALGVAFDGDGDRMLAVDAEGNEVDGDQIVAVLALHLGVDLVAVSQMTNLGFHRLMAERGIRVVTTEVGDRYVLEALRREGGVLGGEQSGHVIYLAGHTSGDGLVAAILLARAIAEQGATLAELAAVMPRYPQAKVNVPIRTKDVPPAVVQAVEQANRELGEGGRVLVRSSGTEPVVRVLAEAETLANAEVFAARIAALVARELG